MAVVLASGILGEADLLANTPTKLYTVPVGVVTTMTVSFCNRNKTSVNVTLLVPQTVNGTTTYFEFETPIGGKGVLERTGIVAQAGRNVMVVSDSTLVTAIVHGFEEAIA